MAAAALTAAISMYAPCCPCPAEAAGPGLANTPGTPTLTNAPAAPLAEEVVTSEALPAVRVQDGRLSVHAEGAPLGLLLKKIASAGGFALDLSTEVADNSITTSFEDVELLRGIQRILLLINHKNYFIDYGEGGQISKLEVYGLAGPEIQKPAPTPTKKTSRPSGQIQSPVQRQTGTQTPRSPALPAIPPRPSQPHTARPQTLPPQGPAPEPPMPAIPMAPPIPMSPPMPSPSMLEPEPPSAPAGNGAEDRLEAVPYIPPAQKPEYIAPQKKIQ